MADVNENENAVSDGPERKRARKSIDIAYDELATFKDVEYVPGGATLNSIRIAQWILQVPKATTYFGCIADDKYGKILREKAEGDGVNAQFQYTEKGEPTGTCAVVLTGDKRSLCANLAAANCFTEDHLDVASHWSLVEKAQYFYIAGFPLTVCPSAILRIAKHANETKKTLCMNLSAPFICQFFKDPLLSVLPYTNDKKEIALKIAAWKKENKDRSRIVIITQGDQPSLVAKGYLSQLVQGKELDECITCGNYAANLIIQRSGCTFPDKPTYQSS
ncbi:hypothetical protein KUTeg_003900 [Tegillarca granosa]|uniref:Adenosine kinase n=1 Tax=Tegillarca granosa TaxID=220873 RepID=A0ABQ9FND2_TEGGR|nr:hypothetical protein KUTeg_003900 [Tegillarca granosa]